MGTAFLHGSGGNNPPELLWENGNSTSTFESPTISLDLSNYTHIAIEYTFSNSYDRRNTSFGDVGTMISLNIISPSGYIGSRSATVTTTGVVFTKANYNGKESDANAIPVKIYGIKGVSA